MEAPVRLSRLQKAASVKQRQRGSCWPASPRCQEWKAPPGPLPPLLR